MKRSFILVAVLSFIYFGFQEAGMQAEVKRETKNINGINRSAQRGAEGVEVLSKTVFNAIKRNDFDMLLNYIPNDEDVEYLKKTSSEKNRYIFENLTGEELMSNTQLNFQKVISAGMDKGVNWAEVEIQESKTSMCKVGDQHVCEALMTLQDVKGRSLKISFDMIQIHERWYLYQGVRLLKSEKASNKG